MSAKPSADTGFAIRLPANVIQYSMPSSRRASKHTDTADLFEETLSAPPARDSYAAPAASLEAQFASLSPAWKACVAPFVDSPAFAKLCAFVDSERAAGKTIYPDTVFHALELVDPDDVKVVILGQDPYHGEDKGIPQAHGLAFSVRPGVRPPPSLRNIFKEIASSLGHPIPTHGTLEYWARQGVLLLNTVLTVERANAASHAKKGWEGFTDTLIAELSERHSGLVFMLWGSHAQAKRSLLHGRDHVILEAPHPSPLSAHRGFLGCQHFVRANEALEARGLKPIDWRLP
ncbi:Uracil-DNA glycosylase [Pararobbsia alpina]